MTLVSTNTGQQQSPALIRLQQSSSSPKFLHLDIESNSRRKIPLSDSLKADDDSSPEESSYRNDDFFDDFDDDALHMTLNDSSKSAVNGNFVEVVKNFCKPYLNSDNCARIPEYSAVEESRNVRNFQCITLPDGKTREIDMKV